MAADPMQTRTDSPFYVSTRPNLYGPPNGIRAGWRLLIFCMIALGLFAVTVEALLLLHVPGRKQNGPSQLTPLDLGSLEIAIRLNNVANCSSQQRRVLPSSRTFEQLNSH